MQPMEGRGSTTGGTGRTWRHGGQNHMSGKKRGARSSESNRRDKKKEGDAGKRGGE